jgi:hypothetical protein
LHKKYIIIISLFLLLSGLLGATYSTTKIYTVQRYVAIKTAEVTGDTSTDAHRRAGYKSYLTHTKRQYAAWEFTSLAMMAAGIGGLMISRKECR